jgi:EmrB/QacA subfamily drug resistance transporter
MSEGNTAAAKWTGIAEPKPLAAIARLACYPWLVVAITCTGAFIGQLDASIVQLALPTLRETFHSSLETVSWVALAYLLAFAACLPVFGRLCEIYGRKLLYLLGYLIFTVASALCGMAPSLTWLIFFRVLQGIGGSILGANSISILVKAIDPGLRARALGIFAAAQAIGVSAGPVAGGLLLGAFGWQAVFWVAVPFGLAAAVIGWMVLPVTAIAAGDKSFDGRGALLLVPALVLLVLALNQVSAWGIASPALIGSVIAGAALIALLVRHEAAIAAPLVDLQLFRHPAFSGGIVAVMLGYAMLYGMFFLMSFALTRGHHDSPTVAGLRLAIIPVAIGLTAPFSGGLSERLGTRGLSVAGMAIGIAGIALLSFAMDTASRLPEMAGMVLFGAGLGVFIAPNTHATIGAAPPTLSGEAGSLLNLMRVMGTSLGVASASSVLSWRTQGQVFDGQIVLDAVETGLAMLAMFAAIAAGASLIRNPTSSAR